MRRFLTALTLLLLAAPALAAVKPGDKPAIRARTVDGQPVTNDALRGKIVIVDFWATWCGPCMAEADHMVRLSREYGPRGVRILGISLDTSADKMKRVAEDKGFTWPQVCDESGWKTPMVKEWGVSGIPATFILSPQGEVVWAGHPANIDEPLARAVEKYPLTLTKEEKIERAVEQVKEAQAALAEEGGEAKALALLGKVPSDLLKEEAVLTEAKDLVAHFRPAADAEDASRIRAALAGDRDGSRAIGALERALAAGSKSEPATRPATPSSGGGDKREALAQARLASAEKLAAAGNHVDAYRVLRSVVERLGDTAAGLAAGEKVRAYEADEKFMAEYKKAAAEQDAKAALAMAGGYEEAGKTDLAAKAYREVVHNFPDTQAAAEAKKALARMGK